MFDGAQNHDPELHPPLNRERLARMAEAGNFWLAPEPLRRRRYGQAIIARWIMALAVAVAVAWVLSEIAVAALLDESRLALLGIAP